MEFGRGCGVDESPNPRNLGVMRILLLAFGLALLAGQAVAQQRPELRFDPNKIEFATPWAQSSSCLGDTRDPICLAQTVVVCGILERRAECTDPRYGGHHNPQGHDRIEYRIARAGIVPFDRLEAMQEDLLGEYDLHRFPMTLRRAVIAQIHIRQSYCPAREASCEGFLGAELSVLVERTRRGWKYVTTTWYSRYAWYAD